MPPLLPKVTPWRPREWIVRRRGGCSMPMSCLDFRVFLQNLGVFDVSGLAGFLAPSVVQQKTQVLSSLALHYRNADLLPCHGLFPASCFFCCFPPFSHSTSWQLATSSPRMNPSSESDVSRTPSSSSFSTDITQPPCQSGNDNNPKVDTSLSSEAFNRWRPSYHLQAPSGWMNVSTSKRGKLMFGCKASGY